MITNLSITICLVTKTDRKRILIRPNEFRVYGACINPADLFFLDN